MDNYNDMTPQPETSQDNAKGEEPMEEETVSLERFIKSMAHGLRWAAILKFRPDLAERCDWSSFDGTSWRVLIEKQPGFADRCDPKKLGLTALVRIGLEQPQLAEKFGLSSIDWSQLDLAALQPEAFLSSKEQGLLWTIFGHGFGGGLDHLTDFVERFPQYAEKCDWEKLANSDMERLSRKTEKPESAKCGNS